jgi:hypothetical protein
MVHFTYARLHSVHSNPDDPNNWTKLLGSGLTKEHVIKPFTQSLAQIYRTFNSFTQLQPCLS